MRPNPWVSALLATTLALVVALVIARSRPVSPGPSATPVTATPTQTASVPVAPTDVPAVGALIESRILPSGTIEVQHWITVSEPIDHLLLGVSRPIAGLSTVAPTRIAVGGEGRPKQPRRLTGDGVQRVDLDRPSATVLLSYDLPHAVTLTPGVAGRGLARVTSIDVSYAGQDGPVRHTVLSTGGAVLALACTRPDAPDEDARPCGSTEGGDWEVVLDGDDRRDQVMAQVDLGGGGAPGVTAAAAAEPARTR